jgi:hypothetical protein
VPLRFDPAVPRRLMGEPAEVGTSLKACARPEAVVAVVSIARRMKSKVP